MKTVLILCDQQQRVEAQLSLVGAIKKRFKVAVIFSYDISHASIERFREQSCECYEVDRTRNRNINSMAPSNFSIAKTKIIKCT